MEPIDRAELERLLLDPDVPDSALRPYLKIEAVESQAFRPNVVVNPAMVTFGAEESALALASLNNIARWRRTPVFAPTAYVLSHWLSLGELSS